MDAVTRFRPYVGDPRKSDTAVVRRTGHHIARSRKLARHVVLLTALSITVFAAPAAADPAGSAICRLLAAGNTPQGLENSVTVRQVLGPDATAADARVYIRSVVAGQCPQFLWRF